MNRKRFTDIAVAAAFLMSSVTVGAQMAESSPLTMRKPGPAAVTPIERVSQGC